MTATSTIDTILATVYRYNSEAELLDVEQWTFNIPFIDYFLVWSALFLTLLICWFVYNILTNKK